MGNNSVNTASNSKGSKRSHVLTPFDYPLSNAEYMGNVYGKNDINHSSHSYYSRFVTNIKQENKSNPYRIHSAPLFSNNSNQFSLNSSLLKIRQHSPSNQQPSFSSIPPFEPRQFNFLWWYPETAFCELDPLLIPLPSPKK